MKAICIIMLVLSLVLTGCMTHVSTQAKKATVPTAHSVSLTCTDTTPGVQFNFYKGSCPGGESATPLNASPLATCSYVDTAVAGLGKYCYIARAYCATCVNGGSGLSVASNEVTATIPSDSQPDAPVLNSPTVANNQVHLNWTIANQSGITVNSTSLFRCSKPTCPAPPKIATVPYPGMAYTDAPGRGTHFYELKANDTVAGRKITTAPSNIQTAVVPK